MAYKNKEKAKAWRDANRHRTAAAKRRYRAKPGTREKENEYHRQYCRDNRDHRTAYARGYRAEHPGYSRGLVRRYGITQAEFESILSDQGNCCAICRVSKDDCRIVVDHNHATDEMRGILCHGCNVGIGVFCEDPCTTTSAAAYLERSLIFPAEVFVRNDHKLYSGDRGDQKIWVRYGVCYTALLALENGCNICHAVPATGKRLHVDHNHVTKQVRGLLCFGCNVGIGYFKESPVALRAASAYLLKWSKL